MIKLMFIIFVLVISQCLVAKVSISKQGNITNYHFIDLELTTFEIVIEGQKFIRAHIKGAQNFEAIKYNLGKPEIPVIRFYAPQGKVTIFMNEEKGLKLGSLENTLVPNLESLEKIPGSQRKLVIDKAFQKSNSAYPRENLETIPAGSLNGHPTQLVTVHPFKYNAATKGYKLISHFTVSISEPMGIESAYKNEQIPTFVFIVGKIFKESKAILKYENFKKELGYKILRIVVDNEFNTPERIREKLKEIYRKTNLKHALIWGDIEHVPSKGSNIIDGVTDHYYRAIDTNDYESDINGPDIGVGRITVKNEQELENVVTKLIKYQTASFDNDSWLKNVSFIATDDRYEVAEASHNHSINTYMVPRDYRGVYPNRDQLGGDKLYAITYQASDEDVVATIKQGRGIINYSGHGGTTVWAGPTVNQDDVRSINHPDALPFVISNACVTGQFTVKESFGETWIKHPHGAIMYWGSMDSTYWDEDDFLERDTYKGIYELNNTDFSEITHYALRELWRRYGGENRSKYYWETYVVFGDPSIKLMTDKVQNILVGGPFSIVRGTEQIQYKITDKDQRPISDIQLSLVGEGETIAFGTTNLQGDVQLEIPKNIPPGDYKLNIYGRNTSIVEKNLTVMVSDEPYLTINDVSIPEQTDLSVTPFQVVNFHFLVKNIARTGSKGASLFIDRIDGNADIDGINMVKIPAIESDSSFKYLGNDLSIKARDVKNLEKIVIHLKWQTVEGQEGHSKIKLVSKRGQVLVSSLDYGDQSNPENGGIRPGENGQIFLTIKNTGNASMEKIKLYPEANDCIESIDGQILINRLAPNEAIRYLQPIHVKLMPNCGNNQMASFKLNGDYGLTRLVELSTQVDFQIGKYAVFTLNQDKPIDIPDNAVLRIPFEVNGNIDLVKDISVRVKINHTYIGDLFISLVHPDGTIVLLRDEIGGSADNLDATYGFDGINVPDLAKIKNKPAKGKWVLNIGDQSDGDSGHLEFMKIKIKGLIE